jgi:hypothetical protein
MKNCPVGTELFYADIRTDGRTDMMLLIVAFHNFPNALKKAITNRHLTEFTLCEQNPISCKLLLLFAVVLSIGFAETSATTLISSDDASWDRVAVFLERVYEVEFPSIDTR